ncbi:MAG: hypothetical protein M3Y09_00615, partial [Actinomycetota bacterium]|nr:hypothetical protein [Actinomycetota bacterium]
MTVALSAGSSASGASASQTGGPLAQQALAGQTDCARLSSAQFVLIGQTVMTRMLGSGAGQNLMTAHMRTVWPAGGLNQAYLFMGRRLAGCAAGNGPRAFGTMMAMMGGGM